MAGTGTSETLQYDIQSNFYTVDISQTNTYIEGPQDREDLRKYIYKGCSEGDITVDGESAGAKGKEVGNFTITIPWSEGRVLDRVTILSFE
jgi:hypothetical protein